ncbi:hypothetical protein OKW50_008291 [Paraburkholderia youngii]|uniref:hypothetical protein n=1 Tax=Paraburkholderia youngii TaxID=2782701 RepID=UPI003D20B0D4
MSLLSLPTMSFIFGGLLVLAGLFGGGLEIKELKLPAIGSVGRYVSFSVGICFIALALWITPPPSLDPPPPKPPQPVSTNVREIPLDKGGGAPDTQHSPQLDAIVDFDAGGDVKMDFHVSGKACSQIKFNLFIDGHQVGSTDFFDKELGLFDLGSVTYGKHSLRVSPEGRVGGCNTGSLQSWGGTLTLYTTTN